jgi:hypothetical protein
MRVATIALAFCGAAALYPALQAADGGKTLSGTPLDNAVIYRDTIPKDAPLRVRVFSSEGVDLGSGESPEKAKAYAAAQEMKRELPQWSTDRLILELKERGFQDVAELPADEPVPAGAWSLEGRFTEMNPGSQAKRYWVGMGAGKSKVCWEARVTDADGGIAADLKHCRMGVMGWFGGRADDQMTVDAAKSSLHLAEFLDQWSAGAYRGEAGETD